jgi:8-oxo-dGTP pyrophosphatase MutT (NUDIX family)
MNIEARIRDRLQELTPRRLSAETAGEAAVLMAVVVRDEVPHFLLTRRTEQVTTHKGQISFPGGIRETGDSSLTDTALRETEEEIGVGRERVEVLGQFHEYLAVTNCLVRPVVGSVSPQAEFRPHDREVQYLLEVPFDFFVRSRPVVKRRFLRGQFCDVYYFNFNDDTIWGLTARMIRDFLQFLSWE